MRSCVVVSMSVVLVAGTLLSAQADPDERFAMWIEPATLETGRSSADVEVYLSSDANGVQGWSLGIEARSGDAVVTIVDYAMGSDLATAGPGQGAPSFFSCTLFPGASQPCPDCTGVTSGVVIDFMSQVAIAATNRFEALKLTLGIDGEEGDPAHLEFTNELGVPPVATVIVVGGDSLVPARLTGAQIVKTSFEGVLFVRGDANADGQIDIADPIFLFQYLFAGERGPVCDDAADAAEDGQINIADSIHILGHLFMDRPLPDPLSECGPDPVEEELGCESFPPCE